MGWLEIGLLAMGAVVLAWNQLLKDAPNITLRFPSLKPPGWLSYVPLALVVLAGAIYGVRQLLPGPNATPSPQVAPAPPPQVISGVSPQQIAGFYENRTDAEASRDVARLNGQTVMVAGTVLNVMGEGAEHTVLLNENPLPNMRVALRFGNIDTELWGVSHLRRGDSIRARCKLQAEGTNEYTIRLQDCRFL